MEVFFSPEFVRKNSSADTTSKSGWIAEAISRKTLNGIRLSEPEDLSVEDLSKTHSPEYIKAVQTGEPKFIAASSGLGWDESLFDCAKAHNAGVVAAVYRALREGVSGSLSSGLHHARFSKGAGFCTFNGLVVAAKAAQAAGAKRILIIDFDAHGGGGTNSLIEFELGIIHLDISVHPYDNFIPSKEGDQTYIVESVNEYLEKIYECLMALNDQSFDLCIYNAGVDPDERCSKGGLKGITEAALKERDRFVFEWCKYRGIPVAFTLAGGYLSEGTLNKKQLIDLHLNTIVEASKIF